MDSGIRFDFRNTIIIMTIQYWRAAFAEAHVQSDSRRGIDEASLRSMEDLVLVVK